LERLFVIEVSQAPSHQGSLRAPLERILGRVGLRRASRARHAFSLVEARLADGIGLHHFGLSPDGCHPFVRAILAATRRSGDPQRVIGDVLAAYYAQVTPGNAADWLDLPRAKAPPSLLWSPPWAATMPWQAQSPAEWRAAREKGVPNENRIAAGEELTILEGWHACGPVSARKAAIEARRLGILLASLREHGLRRHGGRDGDIDAVLLRGSAGQRWWINSGHHRAAVMSALGYETAPIRIRAVVDVRQADAWPQVISGLFTRDQAVSLVEGLISGELPEVARGWARWVRAGALTPLTLVS
jgi:hypothetical protein